MNKVAYALSENLKAKGFAKKDKYTIDEYVEDLKNLQKLIVANVFGEETCETARLESVISHLEQVAAEQHKYRDPRVSRGLVMLKSAAKDLAVTIAGSNAENRVASTMEYVERDDFFFWRNVFLTDGIEETEADFIILTATGIVVLEVKAAKDNITIDETGRILYNGTTCYCDVPISEKMSVKRELLKKKLEAAFAERGMETEAIVDSILVFSTPLKVNVMITDNFRQEKVCTRGKLPFLLNEYETGNRYTRDEMMSLIEILDNLEVHRKAFDADMDMDALREAFAEMMVALGLEAPEMHEEANVRMRLLEKQGIDPASLGIFEEVTLGGETAPEPISAEARAERPAFVGFVMDSGEPVHRGYRGSNNTSDRVGELVNEAMSRLLEESREVMMSAEEFASEQPANDQQTEEQTAPVVKIVPQLTESEKESESVPSQKKETVKVAKQANPAPKKSQNKLTPMGVLAGSVLVGLVAYICAEKFSA